MKQLWLVSISVIWKESLPWPQLNHPELADHPDDALREIITYVLGLTLLIWLSFLTVGELSLRWSNKLYILT